MEAQRIASQAVRMVEEEGDSIEEEEEEDTGEELWPLPTNATRPQKCFMEDDLTFTFRQTWGLPRGSSWWRLDEFVHSYNARVSPPGVHTSRKHTRRRAQRDFSPRSGARLRLAPMTPSHRQRRWG